MSDTIALSLWATNMADPPGSRDAWLAQIEAVMDETSAHGGRLLLMPEYISRTCLPYCGPDLPPSHEVAAMAEEAAALLPALQSLVNGKGLSMLADTWPVNTAAGYSNRAYFLRPGAEPITHELRQGKGDRAHGPQGRQGPRGQAQVLSVWETLH